MPRLWRCASLRGRSMDLCRHPSACPLGLVPTGHPQEAAAEEIEARAAKHMALPQHSCYQPQTDPPWL
jgi:hypothetical protein